MFTLNNETYESSQLSPEGQQVLVLLKEAQSELAKLETHKALLMAAQQQLINQLKPLLPTPIPNDVGMVMNSQGQASNVIPSTSTKKPETMPEHLPKNLPEDLRTKA